MTLLLSGLTRYFLVDWLFSLYNQSWHNNRIDGDVFSFFCFNTDGSYGSVFFVHEIISKVK